MKTTFGLVLCILVGLAACQSRVVKVFAQKIDESGTGKQVGRIPFELKTGISNAAVEISDEEFYKGILKVMSL